MPQYFQYKNFLPNRDMPEQLKFRALQAIIPDKKARSGNEPSQTTTSTQSSGDSQ